MFERHPNQFILIPYLVSHNWYTKYILECFCVVAVWPVTRLVDGNTAIYPLAPSCFAIL